LNRLWSIEHYVCANGKTPFLDWLRKLKDLPARAIILQKLDRMALGHWGLYKSLGKGLFELKVRHGPGYRIYFGVANKKVIILLCGGDKSSQKRDIQRARGYWKDYLR
jgi:putative addiction module killer protein